MRKIALLSIVTLSSVASTVAYAQSGKSSMYATDGDKAAQMGTRLYNSLNPTTPLPVSRGDVLQETARNMGRGQSAKNAWSNAAKTTSGQR